MQSFFGGKNLQLPSACECSLRWNFSISSLHSSCPPSKANRQRQRHSRPCHPRTAGGSFQAAVNSSFFVWEKIHVHTNRRCSDFFFFFWSTTMKRGAGQNTQLPPTPGYVCHNHSVGQLSPPVSLRGKNTNTSFSPPREMFQLFATARYDRSRAFTMDLGGNENEGIIWCNFHSRGQFCPDQSILIKREMTGDEIPRAADERLCIRTWSSHSAPLLANPAAGSNKETWSQVPYPSQGFHSSIFRIATSSF